MHAFDSFNALGRPRASIPKKTQSAWGKNRHKRMHLPEDAFMEEAWENGQNLRVRSFCGARGYQPPLEHIIETLRLGDASKQRLRIPTIQPCRKFGLSTAARVVPASINLRYIVESIGCGASSQ
jgi:hypothetical protein